LKKEIVRTDQAIMPLAGYSSQAVKAGPYVFLSGHSASHLSHGLVPEARVAASFPYQYSIKVQTEYVLGRISAVLEAAGSSLEQTLKLQTFHANMDDLPATLEVRRRYFPSPPAEHGGRVWATRPAGRGRS
jgi:2-iminobutanoate/2-iminopropanoate deaminase